MQTKWSEIQSILGKLLPSGQFRAWIATLVPVQEEESLVLCAQTEFAASHVRTWYGPLLEQAAREVLGPRHRLRIECRPCPDADCAAAHALVKARSVFRPSEETGGDSQLPEPPLSSKNNQAGLVHDALVVRPTRPVISEQTASAPWQGSPAPRPLELMLPGLSGALLDGHTAASPQSEQSWRYSFDDFITGPCNELAYAASRSICNDVMHMDILFLSSAPGLGKTHLIHAVGKYLCAACNRRRPHVELLTAEEFASRFYLSLKAQDTDRFKARYRTADLLLLEDVHFLQGKEKMQAELLATIKALRERGSKIAFSSSFAPRDLKLTDEQLQSRFCSGLLAGIERPDEDTRRRILRAKASFHQVVLPDDVEDALARHIQTDVRQIESCLHNLILKARLFNSRITLQMAWEVIGHYAEHFPIMDLESIIACICQGFGITREQLCSSSRKQEYVCARNTAFFLARKHTDLSLEAIGRRFSRKHSTVLKGITSLEREISRKTPRGLQLSNMLSMIERNANGIVPERQ